MHHVDAYLALRRAVGFKLRATESRLRSFARYADERGNTHVRVDSGVAWAGLARSPQERHVRLRELVLFARHLRAEDPEHEVPPIDVYPPRQSKRLPHIYTDKEVRRILDATKTLGPPGSSRADTYRTLIALLAATGLRVGEALALRLCDITNDGLVVLQTKFRKSRLVPVHPTTRAALITYAQAWRAAASPADPLFVSTKGTALVANTVQQTFDGIRRSLGMLTALEEGNHRNLGPRLHDFRHTFAVRALEACPPPPDVTRHMLALSTYLGHGKVSSTFWYLHVTPQLMVDIADACEAFIDGGGR